MYELQEVRHKEPQELRETKLPPSALAWKASSRLEISTFLNEQDERGGSRRKDVLG